MMDFEKVQCAICGLAVAKLRNETSRTNLDRHGAQVKILSAWKKKYANLISKILFENDSKTFLPHFQNGEYCFICLQKIRDVHSTWKQIKTLEQQIEEFKYDICKSIKCNYSSLEKKSEKKLVDARVSVMQGVQHLSFSYSETVEMIYTVVSKHGFVKESGKKTSPANDEISESEDEAFEDISFNNDGEKYEMEKMKRKRGSGTSALESTFVENQGVKKLKVSDNIRSRTKVQSYEDYISDPDSDAHVSEEDYCESVTECDKDVKSDLNPEIMESETTDVQNSDVYSGNDSGSDFVPGQSGSEEEEVNSESEVASESETSSEEYIPEGKRKTSSRSPSKRGRPQVGITSELILTDSELEIVRKLSGLKAVVTHNLSEAERDLVEKVSDSTVSAIQKLNVSNEEKNFMYRMRTGKRKRRELYKSSKNKNKSVQKKTESSKTPKRPKGRPVSGTVSEIVLSQSELTIIKRLSEAKCVPFHKLSGDENALVAKVAECTPSAIRKLNLSERETGILQKMKNYKQRQEVMKIAKEKYAASWEKN